jgi:hypothetical protein
VLMDPSFCFRSIFIEFAFMLRNEQLDTLVYVLYMDAHAKWRR